MDPQVSQTTTISTNTTTIHTHHPHLTFSHTSKRNSHTFRVYSFRQKTWFSLEFRPQEVYHPLSGKSLGTLVKSPSTGFNESLWFILSFLLLSHFILYYNRDEELLRQTSNIRIYMCWNTYVYKTIFCIKNETYFIFYKLFMTSSFYRCKGSFNP